MLSELQDIGSFILTNLNGFCVRCQIFQFKSRLFDHQAHMFPTKTHFLLEKLPFFVPKEPPVLTINRCCSWMGFPWCSYVFLISAILQGADYSKIPRKLLEVLQDYIASSTTWRLSCHQPLGSSVGRWVGCGCLGLWGGRRLSDRTEITVQDSRIVPSCPVPQFLLVTYLHSDG